MRYWTRMAAIAGLLTISALAACGNDDEAVQETLPPIATTTTTTTMPPTTTTIPETYVIQSGESLFSIAEQFGLNYLDLAAYNGITNPDDIQAGQRLRIPQPGESTPTTIVDLSSTTAAP